MLQREIFDVSLELVPQQLIHWNLFHGIRGKKTNLTIVLQQALYVTMPQVLPLSLTGDGQSSVV